MPSSKEPRHRVASLLPAATEIVCAVGGADLLVGVSHECDHPPCVRELPRLTRSRLEEDRETGRNRTAETSSGIDREVASLLSRALGIYDIDLQALSAGDPTLVITQDLCEVCAVSRTALERALAEIDLPEVELLSLNPLRLDDLWKDMLRVGAALGLADDARRSVDFLKQRVSAIAARAGKASARPSVLAIEWIDPVMIGGLWMPELIELAGGAALCARVGERARTLSLPELAELSPDIVLIKPCGFDLERTAQEAPALHDLIAAMPWPARERNQVFAADGNAFFNRPGPRLVESLEILAACTHPDIFPDLAARHVRSFAPLSSLAPA